MSFAHESATSTGFLGGVRPGGHTRATDSNDGMVILWALTGLNYLQYPVEWACSITRDEHGCSSAAPMKSDNSPDCCNPPPSALRVRRCWWVGPSGCGKSSLVRAGLLLVRQHTVEVRATAHAARGLACTSQPTKAHSMALGCGSAQHHPDLVEFRDSRDVL